MTVNSKTEDQEFTEARAGHEALLRGFLSIQLGTANHAGVPEVATLLP